MASGYTPTRMDPSLGGGGSGWERNINNQPARDIGTAAPQFDRFGNSLGFGWKNSDGTITLINGDRMTQYGGLLSNGSGEAFRDVGMTQQGEGDSQGGNSRYGPYSEGYRNDPNMTPPESLQNNETYFGEGGGGGGGGNGGGVPLALKKLAPFAALAPTLRNALGGNDTGTNTTMPPELQQLLQMSLQRMTSQDPLFRSINAQAMAGLPTAYQRS